MASNIITAVIPKIYTALKTVNREQVGFIPAVRRDTKLERAAVGQTIDFPVVPQGTLEDTNVGMTVTATGGQTFTNDNLTIEYSKTYPMIWKGAEQKALKNGDSPQYNDIIAQQFAQGFRTLSNYVEETIAQRYIYASMAYGTAATAPFSTAGSLSDFAGIKQLFRKNGTPRTDMQIVLNDSSMFQLEGTQSSLWKANEAGTTELLRNGMISRVQGFNIHESEGLSSHTKGTGASYTTSAAGFSVGTTSIPIITGTGTVLAGDVVTFAGDTNKYIVKTGVTAAGTIVIAEPGLKVAIEEEATAVTIGGTYSVNSAFDRNAIILVARPPEAPEEGDLAMSSRMIVDPMTGIPYELRIYPGVRQVKLELSLAWGVKVTNPENLFTLLG